MNYRMAQITEKIIQMRHTTNININHCYREANQLANYLAKLATKAQNGSYYFSSQQLSKGAKGPFHLDKKAKF